MYVQRRSFFVLAHGYVLASGCVCVCVWTSVSVHVCVCVYVCACIMYMHNVHVYVHTVCVCACADIHEIIVCVCVYMYGRWHHGAAAWGRERLLTMFLHLGFLPAAICGLHVMVMEADN